MNTNNTITPACDLDNPFAGMPYISKHEPNMPDVMTEYDHHQVIHGIPFASRHNNPREVSEMTAFCNLLEQRGLSAFVQSVFYNSNADTCDIGLTEPLEVSDEAARGIEAAALDTLTQFVWFDGYQQGRPFDETNERMAREDGLIDENGQIIEPETKEPGERETQQGQVQGERE